MLIQQHSGKTLAEIDQALRDAVARHKFGVVAVHDLQQTMRNKGVEYGSACMIYEVCNPQQARAALTANGAVSTALPCRISVYSCNGGFEIATIRPSAMMQMFGPELAPVAEEVEVALTAIISESA